MRAMRLTDASKTRRMIAGCCATPTHLAFDDKRPRVSAFRTGFGAGAPPRREGREEMDVLWREAGWLGCGRDARG